VRVSGFVDPTKEKTVRRRIKFYTLDIGDTFVDPETELMCIKTDDDQGQTPPPNQYIVFINPDDMVEVDDQAS